MFASHTLCERVRTVTSCPARMPMYVYHSRLSTVPLKLSASQLLGMDSSSDRSRSPSRNTFDRDRHSRSRSSRTGSRSRSSDSETRHRRRRLSSRSRDSRRSSRSHRRRGRSRKRHRQTALDIATTCVFVYHLVCMFVCAPNTSLALAMPFCISDRT